MGSVKTFFIRQVPLRSEFVILAYSQNECTGLPAGLYCVGWLVRMVLLLLSEHHGQGRGGDDGAGEQQGRLAHYVLYTPIRNIQYCYGYLHLCDSGSS